MELKGIHHLTAVTADAPGNHKFYTQTMGLRLVKKTVNQDDTSAYHLFYADGLGSPGTDITFFDWPVGRERRGTPLDLPHWFSCDRRRFSQVLGASPDHARRQA